MAYISSGCAMFLNRSISTFTVLPVNSVRVESGISFYLLVGYMSNDMFNVLFCKEVDHNFVTKSVSLNLEETFGISEGTEFFVKYCTEDDSTDSNWRVCYPGLQSSISLTKRSSSLDKRPLTDESIVNIVHKLITTNMTKACKTGLHLMMIIKSPPFEFFRPL